MKELSKNEMKKTNGGVAWWAALALGAVGTFLYEIANDWENNIDAFWQGYEDTKKKLEANL